MKDHTRCDELYLQLIKLTSNHPNPGNYEVVNFWKLMSVLTCVILPRGLVLDYLKAHLRLSGAMDSRYKLKYKEESQHARFCLRSLQKLQHSERKVPPSLDEILSSSKMNSLRLKFGFPDKEFRYISFDSSATVKDVTQRIMEQVSLSGSTGYAIYGLDNDVERLLEETDILSDVLSIHALQLNSGRFYDKLSYDKTNLVFRKRICNLTKANKKNPIDEGFMFSQSLKDMKIGLFPLNNDQAILIIALLVQIKFGDYGTNEVK